MCLIKVDFKLIYLTKVVLIWHSTFVGGYIAGEFSWVEWILQVNLTMIESTDISTEKDTKFGLVMNDHNLLWFKTNAFCIYIFYSHLMGSASNGDKS